MLIYAEDPDDFFRIGDYVKPVVRAKDKLGFDRETDV